MLDNLNNDRLEIISTAEMMTTAASETIDPTCYAQDFYAAPAYLPFINHWLDTCGDLWYPVDGVFSLLEEIKRAVPPAQFLSSFTFSWNIYCGAAGFFSGIENLRHFKTAKKHKNLKLVNGVTDLLLGAHLSVLSPIALAAELGVITGTLAAVVAPFGGFSFAVWMWIEALRASHALIESVKKLNFVYLIKDKIKQFNEAQKQFAQSHYIDKYWQQVTAQLKQQITALVLIQDQKYYQEENEHYEIEQPFHASLLKDTLIAHFIYQQKVSKRAITKHDHFIASSLMENQITKVEDNVLNTVAYVTAAVGMTLVVLAPFTGPAAGGVFAVGSLLMVVAGLMKLGNVVGNKLIDFISYRTEANQIKNELFMSLNEDEKLAKKIELAYQFSQPHFETQITLEAYRESVLHLKPRIQRKLLEAALNHYIKLTILNKYAPQVSSAQTAGLSDQNINQIVARNCRQRFFHKINTPFRKLLGWETTHESHQLIPRRS